MKQTVLSLLMFVFCASSIMAQDTSPTATRDVYDFSGFGDKQLLDLFYNALQQGRNYPTKAEFENAGIQASDLAFVRSHVRKRNILDRSDRAVAQTYDKRNLWMNIPMGVGSGGKAGYPTSIFTSDVYSMWNYTHLFGSWNHSIFQAPGCWVDAAHKNGTDIMSGIKFFESWNTGDGSWSSMIVEKNSDGSYKYVKPLINCLMFFGSDGINFNWEDSSYSRADIVAFHKALYQEAYSQGFDNFHIGIYTSNSALTNSNVDALLGKTSTGKTADVMLNYSAGDFSYDIAPSVEVAEANWGSTDGLYAGVWIVSMDRGWDRLDVDDYDGSDSPHRCNLCLWGEHGQSRFMSYNRGAGTFETQANYQRLLERAFSGGNRNPLTRPVPKSSGNNWESTATKLPLQTFCGLAEFIPERSAIQGNLPFQTHFNLGNGDRYLYKGKRTAGPWYNMAAQDLVPTYRWMIVNRETTTPSTNASVEFCHEDAYTGGSCLKVEANGQADIVLYKTSLKATSGTVVAKIAVKDAYEPGQSHSVGTPSIIVRKQGGQWVEASFDAPENGGTWKEMTATLSLAAGDVIDRIGLRTNGTYKTYVGKLEISDDAKVQPANVKDLVAEVKEETKNSLSAKIHWDIDQAGGTRAAWDMVFNDEANINHFEILYKNGENGKISEIGRTSQWAAYVGNIEFESASDRPFVGVRAASIDMKTYSPIVWLEIPRADQSLLPDAGGSADTYGISELDPDSENAHIAKAERFLTDVTTTGADQNLNYHTTEPVEDGTQHANALNHVLKVSQGQTIQLFIKAHDTTNNHLGPNPDGLRWCIGGGWIDYNGSGTFDHPMGTTPAYAGEPTDPEGERIFRFGEVRKGFPVIETEGVSFTFTIPEDAHVGKSRLRMCFADAWFEGSFQPTGLLAKGFSIDFTVEITGETDGQRTFTDLHDQGEADEPEGLDATGINDNQATKGVSHATVNDGQVGLNNVDKAWFYTIDGQFVRFVANAKNNATIRLRPGVYIVKMQNGNIIRTQKLTVK